MTALRIKLDKLGLSDYCDKFFAEGFDTWEAVCDVTESDLNELNVKLGHRRKLQRSIVEFRAQTKTSPLVIVPGKRRNPDDHTQLADAGRSRDASQAQINDDGPRQKRKYRRHPKPDENAPERPASAYVIFSNHMREQLKAQDLSFTEMAKVVGERWQLLSADNREIYEKQANAAKERYNTDMAEYKKTDSFSQYQEYLADFKAKNTQQDQADARRVIKLPTQDSTNSTNSYESHDSGNARRKSGWSSSGRPPMSTETTASTQDSYSRSPSTSYDASGAQSPPSKENGVLLPSFTHPKSSTHLADAFVVPLNTYNRPSDQSYTRRVSIGRSPPSNGFPLSQESLYLNTRSTSSLFSQQQGATNFERKPFTYSQPPAFGARASEYTDHPAVRSYPPPSIDKDFPYTLPPVRTSSNTQILPPMAPPPHDPRLSSSLATLLLAAERAEALPVSADGA